jgi:hypothetical protein
MLCLGCGGPLRSISKTGYCVTTVECKRAGQRVRKGYSSEAAYLDREPVPCRECRMPTRTITGICQRTERCRRAYQAAYDEGIRR